MKISFACPICGANEWIKGENYIVRRDLVNTESRRLRYRVLLDVWFPSQPEVTLQGISCGRCGFIAYSPRPDEEDMTAKYSSDPLGTPGSTAETRLGVYMDMRRAWKGYRAATRSLGRLGRSVLDIGGGDGKLLKPFIEHGFDCYVIDYNSSPISGVTRLGSTISDLVPGRRFDVILCNHFLEHIVDPLGVVKALTNHITATGVLHVEVPDEVWGGLPLPHNASMHVNYFTKRTAELLLKLGGWRPIWSKTHAGSYGEVAIAVTNIVALADPTMAIGEAEYAAASRDSRMRLCADSHLRREHFKILASQVRLQAGSMLKEGHVVTNIQTIVERVAQSIKTRG